MSVSEHTVKVKVELEGIDEIKRFHAEPGDVLVFQAADNVSAHQIHDACTKLKEKLPDVTVIVCSHMELAGLMNVDNIRPVMP